MYKKSAMFLFAAGLKAVILFDSCRCFQAEIAAFADWNKDTLAERYAKHKNPSTILVAQGFPKEFDKHVLSRAVVTPPIALQDAVWEGCFENEGVKMSLKEFKKVFEQV